MLGGESDETARTWYKTLKEIQKHSNCPFFDYFRSIWLFMCLIRCFSSNTFLISNVCSNCWRHVLVVPSNTVVSYMPLLQSRILTVLHKLLFYSTVFTVSIIEIVLTSIWYPESRHDNSAHYNVYISNWHSSIRYLIKDCSFF